MLMLLLDLFCFGMGGGGGVWCGWVTGDGGVFLLNRSRIREQPSVEILVFIVV